MNTIEIMHTCLVGILGTYYIACVNDQGAMHMYEGGTDVGIGNGF